MDPTIALLQAIRSLWPQLPDLIGDDWPQFRSQLEGYLERLEADPAQESITRALILDHFSQYPEAHQRLIGEMVAFQSQQLPSTYGTLERTTPALTRLLHPTITRYAEVTCPRRVWVQMPRVPVVVRLTMRPPGYGADIVELAAYTGMPVRVRIDAPAFDILNSAEQETLILPNADSTPDLAFDLRPRDTGCTRIYLDFFQAGNPIGTVSVPVEVTAHETSAQEASRFGRVLRAEPDAPPPDRMLYIAYERFQGQPALRFELRRGSDAGRRFYPTLLGSDPKTYIEQLYERLLTAHAIDPARSAGPERRQVLPPEDPEQVLRTLGQNLWRELIPEELKRAYAIERGSWHDETLLIVSDEPHIPWELIWPYGHGWPDAGPWCITMRLSRWLSRGPQGDGHEAPPVLLRFGALACLAPTAPDLAVAREERRLLAELTSRYALSDLSPDPPTWPQVIELLEAGGYDWIHVAAQDRFHPTAPDADSAVWLQDGRALTPEAIVGSDIEERIRERRPGFVFNACHGGRQGWALTRLGGWTNRLIGNGAGLLLAPLWEATDDRALDFIRAFYQGLLDGETVAEATRQARLAVRRAGDPTWLAYSLYAHPNARVVLSSQQET